MGPSLRALGARILVTWLRRQDSNLQSPDPESGALPIWPLLSAALKYNQRPSRAPPHPRATLSARCYLIDVWRSVSAWRLTSASHRDSSAGSAEWRSIM